MARPHIEFVQSQRIPWQDTEAFGVSGVQAKWLCRDDEDGSFTALASWPKDWRGVWPQGAADIDCDEELYVLEGELAVDDVVLRRHGYAYLPRNDRPRKVRIIAPTTLIIWRHVGALPWRSASGESPLVLHTMEMPWDTSVWEAKLNHLRIARKTLRVGPDSTRTYLLAGLPHGYPESGKAGLETHPYPEEMLMVAGDMWSPQGRMTRGAYFYRPPHISHGRHWSELGFLMLMRTPGANRPITAWSEPLPVERDNPFTPDLPPGSADEVRKPYVAVSDF